MPIVRDAASTRGAAVLAVRVATFLAGIAFGMLSVSADAAQLVPKDTANAIKVVGHYKQYNVYDLDGSDLGLDIGPFPINGTIFPSAIEVADAMTPVDTQDALQGNANGIRCEFLCVNPKGEVVGYNPTLYAKMKGATFPVTPPAQQAPITQAVAAPRPIGQWHGYQVYEFASASAMDTQGVIIAGSTYFSQLAELTAFLPAISEAAVPEGVVCYFLCTINFKRNRLVMAP
jgi:hypothetical protein